MFLAKYIEAGFILCKSVLTPFYVVSYLQQFVEVDDKICFFEDGELVYSRYRIWSCKLEEGKAKEFVMKWLVLKGCQSKNSRKGYSSSTGRDLLQRFPLACGCKLSKLARGDIWRTLKVLVE